ncbi:hypothetical protein [Nocardia sp. NPDC049149]|uniref:hypothetical protein n=1 Tax=Nocardia sp. NPDC049149 TaxID=3364315 RepID=UPI003722ACFF
MSGLWNELGKKLAEQWLSLLVLPGALYVAVTVIAVTLGHTHALDLGLLVRQITAQAKNPAVTNASGQIVVLLAVLAAAAAVGLVAQGIGAFVERAVLATGWRAWPRPLAAVTSTWVHRRQARWDKAHNRFRHQYQAALAPDPADRPDPAARHRAAHARSRIAVERPERPTWSGDRVHAAALRLDRDHHLDLATVWPFTWLVLPSETQADITRTRTAITRAATLAGWAVLYLALSSRWWPAAPLAVVLTFTARHRLRSGIDSYATLLEVTTRAYATTLAAQLGIGHTGPLTPQLGGTLTQQLRHSGPPHPPEPA